MTTEQKLVPPDVADGEEDFVASLQSFASYCESGAFSPDDGPMLASKFRDATFVVDQLMKLRDGKIASGFRLAPAAPAAPAPEPVAYRWTPKTIRMWAYGAQVPHGADNSGFEIQPLYAAPPAPIAPAPAAVKALDLMGGVAATIFGIYRIIRRADGLFDAEAPGGDRLSGTFASEDEAVAALNLDYARRVLACLEPGQGWRDIASAPRDGSLVLVYAPDFRSVEIAYFCPETGLWPSAHDEMTAEEGEPCNVGLPTHWQPLPPPPAAEGSR